MLKIGIIAGTTRPNSRVTTVANWFLDIAKVRTDVAWELVDIDAYKLPNLD